MAIRRNFTNSLCEKYGKDEADALFFYAVETLTGLDKAQILAKDDYGLTR